MKLITIFFCLIILINLFALDYFIFLKPSVQDPPTPTPTPLPTPTLSVPAPTSIPTTTSKPSPYHPTPQKSVSYLPVPGSGSTLSLTWVDIPGTDFYFNSDDFPNLTESYFSGSIKLFNGNGTAFFRLFDVTAGIEVWGSDIKTSSQSFVFITSGKLTFRSGNRLYRVQGKTLTADTAVFNSGQLRLISQN